MQGIKLIETNGKITHFLRAEHYYDNDNVVIVEYDAENNEIDKHYINESEIKEIKYEG